MHNNYYANNPKIPYLSQPNNKTKLNVLDQDSQSPFGSPASMVKIQNNTAAQMIAKQRMFSTTFFTRMDLEEMHRQSV